MSASLPFCPPICFPLRLPPPNHPTLPLSTRQYDLAVSYATGEGVRQSHTKALKWVTKAAEQGNVNAQAQLAQCYFKGVGVPKSSEQAMMWWSRAAAQGHAQARFVLDHLKTGGRVGLPFL